MTQIANLEELYNKYFGKEKGFFVEVGGYDGKSNSNTSILAEWGWKGVYIEPVQEYASLCSLYYKVNTNILVINKAAGEKKCVKEMSIRGQNSTFEYQAMDSGEFPEDWKIEKETEKRLIEVDTLDSILNNIIGKIDLLVIDTELYEDKVLEGFNIKKYDPKMVIIELHEQSIEWASIPRQKEIINRINGYFAWNQYEKIYNDVINTIFIK